MGPGGGGSEHRYLFLLGRKAETGQQLPWAGRERGREFPRWEVSGCTCVLMRMIRRGSKPGEARKRVLTARAKSSRR